MSALDQAFIRAYAADQAQMLSPPMTAPSDAARGGARPTSAVAAQSHGAVQQRSPREAPPAVTPATQHRCQSPPAAAPAPSPQPSVRRPLSSFAQPQPVESRFTPALEVDQFRWSRACDQLVQRYARQFEPAVDALLAVDEAGRSLIGVAGAARGVGCTTVAVCLARLLVEAGKTVAVVDGNFAAPGLAREVGLFVENGWEEVLAGSLPLAEGVVHSIADSLAVLPLVAGGLAAAERLDSIHSSVTAGVLRYHYDMVLFDLGALADPFQGPVALRLAGQCRLDGVILTAGPDRQSARPAPIDHAPALADLCFGVVENQLRAA